MPDRLPGVADALRAAARRFATPVVVTDVATIEAAADEVRAAFPDPWERSFSVKANDVAAIVRLVVEGGFGANVVSRGEWAVARRAGLPNERITLEGVARRTPTFEPPSAPRSRGRRSAGSRSSRRTRRRSSPRWHGAGRGREIGR